MTYGKTRAVLRNQGLAPHKKLGQNFLVHRRTAERIVGLAGPEEDDTIVEVGVGLGALTLPLAARVRQVIGIEADSGLVRWHEQEHDLPENVRLIHEDILKTDLVKLAGQAGGRLKIIANLPYSISSPFLFRLIDNHELMDWAVVMLQKEVALRLMAEPGTKEYGVPTVLLAGCAEIKPLLEINREEFHPRPRVDSMVIGISFQPLPQRVSAVGDFDRVLFKKIVHSSFGQRRKTLLNALTAAGVAPDKKTLAQKIAAAGLPAAIRAERLSFEQFVNLSRCIGASGVLEENL